MYVSPNYKTKKLLKEAIAKGEIVKAFNPGLGGSTDNTVGDYSVVGPHYPKPHRWYARVRVDRGRVVKVIG